MLLIGVDGMDLEVLRALVEQGRVRHLARLLRRGASGVLLSEREIRSPAIWSTIATGRPRSVHGIYDFVTGSRLWPAALRDAPQRLVTSKMRQVPALWNLASAAGRKVAVVGWLNTWPAEQVNGTMVSPYVAIGRAKQITIKGTVYPDEPYQVWPESSWSKIRQLITPPDEVPDDLLESFCEEAPPALLHDLPLLARYLDGLRWSLSHTLTMKAIALRLIAEERPDFTAVYLEGADSLGHRFWLFRQPLAKVVAQMEEAGLATDAAEDLKRLYGEVVDRYYELLDGIVAELTRALGKRGRVLVVSDHGFGDRSGRYPVSAAVPFSGEHQLEGALIAAGPDVEAGTTVYGASIYDVTPTVLEWLDVDAALPFEGRSLVRAMAPAAAAASAAAEDGDEARAEAEELDDEGFRAEELERLRSLGYVQ